MCMFRTMIQTKKIKEKMLPANSERMYIIERTNVKRKLMSSLE